MERSSGFYRGVDGGMEGCGGDLEGYFGVDNQKIVELDWVMDRDVK